MLTGNGLVNKDSLCNNITI